MKFCPDCGAELIKEDATFCVECGARLTDDAKPRKSDSKSTGKYAKEKPKKQSKPAKSAPVPQEPMDDGYDGYYDDVLPPDLDREKDGMDKELVKKIVALGVGVVFIIAICVVMMYVL